MRDQATALGHERSLGKAAELRKKRKPNMAGLNPFDMALYRAVDEVLHYLWDPIGVAAVPEARDEYHGYLPRLFRMLKEGANEEELAQELSSITTERMGLSARSDHDRVIARYLLHWKAAVANREG